MGNPKLLRGRMSQPGAYYSVTTVTHGRQPLFRAMPAAKIVIAEIGSCVGRGEVVSLAWVVMPDHLHWLLQLRAVSLSRCLQTFKSQSARALNAARQTRGRIWQIGFYDHRLRGDQDLRAQARYVVANPLRRGLVERIEDYPFWWCRWIADNADL